MTPQHLIRKIKRLSVRAPHTEALEEALEWKSSSYANQKQHWLAWLSEYDSPGYYGRTRFDRDAEFAYNHCGCPPMVLWLGEASGIDEDLVKRARGAAARSGGTFSTKCAVIRRNVPWRALEVVLSVR